MIDYIIIIFSLYMINFLSLGFWCDYALKNPKIDNFFIWNEMIYAFSYLALYVLCFIWRDYSIYEIYFALTHIFFSCVILFFCYQKSKFEEEKKRFIFWK